MLTTMQSELYQCICNHKAAAIIAFMVSIGNRCRFCADVHEAVLYAHGLRKEATALRNHCFESIAEPQLRHAALWAFAPGGPAPSEWIHAATMTHYANRVSNVLIRRPAFSITPMLFRPWIVRRWMRNRTDGVSPTPAVSVVPQQVKERVLTHIRAWYGEEMGPNRGWVENYLADFTPADRAIGRLALLTALASHQVDEMVIDAFQEVRPAPDDLTLAVCWAASQAAARVMAAGTGRVVNAAA